MSTTSPPTDRVYMFENGEAFNYGSAFAHVSGGGFTITLDVMPLSGSYCCLMQSKSR